MTSEPRPAGQAGPLPAGRNVWLVAGMLSLAHAMSVMDRYLLSVVLEDVKAHLALTDTQLGILQGPAFVLFYMTASIPLGRVADVGSRRLLAAGGLLIWTVATLVCGLATNFAQLLGARMVVGLGEAALLPAAMSLITAYFTKDKLSRGIAIYTMGGTIGRSAAFIVGGAGFAWAVARGGLRPFGLVDLAPWQTVFVAAGLLGIPIALLLLAVVREPPRVPRVKTGWRAGGLAFFWRNFQCYMAIFIPFAMASAIQALLGAWGVSFFLRIHKLEVAAVTFLVGMTSLLVGPGRSLVGGWLNDELCKRGLRGAQAWVLGGALPLAAVCVILFAVAPLPLSVLGYGAAYFCLAAAAPTAYSGVQVVTEDAHRGLLSALMLVFAAGLGTQVGPMLVGLLSDTFTTQQPLRSAVIATVLVLCAVGTIANWLCKGAFEKRVAD